MMNTKKANENQKKNINKTPIRQNGVNRKKRLTPFLNAEHKPSPLREGGKPQEKTDEGQNGMPRSVYPTNVQRIITKQSVFKNLITSENSD